MAPAGPKGQGDVTQVASLVSVLQSHLGGNAKKTLFQLSLWTAEIFVHVYEFREMHVTTGEDLKAAK